ncbi:family 10 glycosylhydrolase [bacterium]|nr:family 10 glycosylhydrolase [bacterium]
MFSTKQKRVSAKLTALGLILTLSTSCKLTTGSSISGKSSTSSKRVGVWLTNVGSKVLYSKASIDKAVDRSHSFGINSIYPVVWNKEEVFFQSEAVKKHLGKQFIAAPDGMDVLLEVIRSSMSKGMSTYAWFENGLKVPVQWENGDYFALGRVLKSKGWLTTDKNGKLFPKCEFGVCKGFLNPFLPDVRAFLIEFVAEIAKHYGVEGVMIDDHFSMHPSMGYDPYTRKLYRAHLKKKEWRDTDHNFKMFRSENIVGLINEMKNAVRAHGKKLILSPGGDPSWSKKEWLLDWDKAVWTKSVDEIIMQSYRYDIGSYRRLVGQGHVTKLAKVLPFATGVLFGLKNNTRSTGRLIYEQTKYSIERGYGVSYFYYDTIDTPASSLETSAERQQWLRKTTELLKSR